MLCNTPKQPHARPWKLKLPEFPFARLPSLSLICSMIFLAILVIMHRALSQEISLAITITMVSAVTFTLLRCNSTTPSTTRQSPFLKTLIAKEVLQLLEHVRSILHWTQQVDSMLPTTTLITGPMLSIQRWTGTQLLFLTWPVWHSTNRVARLARFSTRVTPATTHNQLPANFLVCALISVVMTLTPSTPTTTIVIQICGLSKPLSKWSRTTWTASIILAIQSSSALLWTGAVIPISVKAKTFPMVNVKPVNSSLLLWSTAGYLATVTALSPTNEALWHTLYMFEKFVYPICRKK